MYLLDTDILIDVQRGHMPAVPGFVLMELIQDAQNSRQVEQVMKLVHPLPVVWPSPTHCAQALEYFRLYHLSHKLGLLDALIGTCALCLSASLCTFNVKHYRAIPGLAIFQPYDR